MVSERSNDDRPQRRTRADGRETARRIIEFAEKELVQSGLVNFNLDRVINESGVSRSSVYHHFGGREGVIAAVETQWLISTLNTGYREMATMFSSIANGEEAFKVIELGIAGSGSPRQREIRERRISTLAMSRTSPTTRELLREMQARGTEEFADLIRQGRDNGLFDPIEPVEGIAHLIQSMLLGRILVDILDDPDQDAKWTEVTVQTLRLMLRPVS